MFYGFFVLGLETLRKLLDMMFPTKSRTLILCASFKTLMCGRANIEKAMLAPKILRENFSFKRL